MQAYLAEWEPAFRARTAGYSKGPVQNRTYQDVCCFVFFVIMLIAFITIGGNVIY